MCPVDSQTPERRPARRSAIVGEQAKLTLSKSSLSLTESKRGQELPNAQPLPKMDKDD